MGRDIRNIIEEQSEAKLSMPKGHKERFSQMLDESFPEKKGGSVPRHWMQIAAVLLGVGGIATVMILLNPADEITSVPVTTVQEQTVKTITLGDLSPELNKIEDFYLASIQYELAALDSDPKYKELMDQYVKQLSALDEEYKKLTEELNTIGPNENTVSAMINNLQLRLELLYRLKQKLNELKTDNHETDDLISA